MEDNFAQTRKLRAVPQDMLHTLNNQLQILLVSAEKLALLTCHDQDARKQCSAIESSARKIAELISTLTRESSPPDATQAALQEWVTAFFEREKKRDAETSIRLK